MRSAIRESSSSEIYRRTPPTLQPKFDSWPNNMLFTRKISKIIEIEFDSWVIFVGKNERLTLLIIVSFEIQAQNEDFVAEFFSNTWNCQIDYPD